MKRQRGYILLLTIVVTAVLAVIVSYFAERIDAARQFAARQADASEALLGMSDDRAETLFRMATSSVTIQGLGAGDHVVRLDNRVYVTHNARLQLQDTAGLFSLGMTDDASLGRLLSACGVPQALLPQLVDVFQDYIDASGLKRLHGAGKSDYLALGLPPPANRPLVSTLELRAMLVWRDLPDEMYQCVIRHSTLTANRININTADAIVLQTLPGMDARGAKALLDHRTEEQLSDPTLAGKSGNQDSLNLTMTVGLFPSSTIRITQSSPLIGWRAEYEVTMTPLDSHAPWRIDAYRRTPVDIVGADSTRMPSETPLPPFDLSDTKNDIALPTQF